PEAAQAVTVTRQNMAEALQGLLESANMPATPENMKMASALFSFGQKVTPGNLQAMHQALQGLGRADAPAVEAAAILIARGLPVTPAGVAAVAGFLTSPAFGPGLSELQQQLQQVVQRLPKQLGITIPDLVGA